MDIGAAGCREPEGTPRCPSRLTLKLSGPATNRRRSRSRNAPGGRVRCSARLGGATTGRKPPRHRRLARPAACDDGAAATAHDDDRRRGTGAARSGDRPIGYRRRRMPRAEAHAPMAEPPNDKAQRTGRRPVTLMLPETARGGRVRCSARLGVFFAAFVDELTGRSDVSFAISASNAWRILAMDSCRSCPYSDW